MVQRAGITIGLQPQECRCPQSKQLLDPGAAGGAALHGTNTEVRGWIAKGAEIILQQLAA